MRVLSCGLIVLLLAGCAGHAVNSRLRALDAELTPLVGQPKSVLLMKYGPPGFTHTEGEVEVWQYHFSYGTKTRYPKNLWTGEYLGTANTWERYDDITLFFVNDTLTQYKTYVQR